MFPFVLCIDTLLQYRTVCARLCASHDSTTRTSARPRTADTTYRRRTFGAAGHERLLPVNISAFLHPGPLSLVWAGYASIRYAFRELTLSAQSFIASTLANLPTRFTDLPQLDLSCPSSAE